MRMQLCRVIAVLSVFFTISCQSNGVVLRSSVPTSITNATKSTIKSVIQAAAISPSNNQSNQHSHAHDDNSSPPALPPLNPQNPPVVQITGLTPPESPPPNTPVIPLSPPQSTMLFSTGSGGSGGGGGGSSSGSSTSATQTTPQPNHELLISDVVLTSTAQSIVSTNTASTAAIIPNYAGKTVSLTINGTFNTAPATTLEHMNFIMEPGLLHQSWVGKEPSVRVLLDSSIIWTPVSVSSTQIVVTLDTQAIPDLYLAGNSHTLQVAAGELIAEVPVRVGEPEAPAQLSPTISQIEILRDDQNQPLNLKVTGQNLMLYYRFSHIQTDGKPVFGHQTNVVTGPDGLVWELIIHLPTDFVEAGPHTLMIVTPFGASFKGFGG